MGDKSKTKKKGPGRPQAEINWKTVDTYLRAGCSGVEVAQMLGIHEDTFYNACQRDNNMCFSEYLQQKKSGGNAMLKAKQFDLAMKGDKTMLIWLGKQRLQQKDKHESEVRVTNEFERYTDEELRNFMEDDTRPSD